MSRLGKVGSDSDGRVDDAAPSSVLKEDEVARTIAMMASTLNGALDSTLSTNLHRGFTNNLGTSNEYGSTNNSADSTTAPTTWNADVISTVLREDFDRLNWDLVIRGLDQEDYAISNPKAFAFVISIYRNASGRHAAKDLPYASLFATWKYSSNQLHILKQAVIAPPSVFTFAFSERRQPPLAMDDSTVSYGTPNQAWCSVDLLDTLVRIVRGREV